MIELGRRLVYVSNSINLFQPGAAFFMPESSNGITAGVIEQSVSDFTLGADPLRGIVSAISPPQGGGPAARSGVLTAATALRGYRARDVAARLQLDPVALRAPSHVSRVGVITPTVCNSGPPGGSAGACKWPGTGSTMTDGVGRSALLVADWRQTGRAVAQAEAGAPAGAKPLRRGQAGAVEVGDHGGSGGEAESRDGADTRGGGQIAAEANGGHTPRGGRRRGGEARWGRAGSGRRGGGRARGAGAGGG
jgi:hypothetical protein